MQDLLVDSDDVVSNYQSSSQWHTLCSLAPRMVVYLSNAISLCWVDVQHLLYQILEILAYKIRENIIPREDSLVEFSGVVVLERQIATNHSEENDSARPNVHF